MDAEEGLFITCLDFLADADNDTNIVSYLEFVFGLNRKTLQKSLRAYDKYMTRK